MIDYIDVENYSAISGELSFRNIDVKSIVNIETKKKYFRIWFEQDAEISDKEMLDWLEKIMIKGDNYCEVYFAGLRHGANDATEFQIESNPEKFKVIKGKNIREIIKKAIKNYEKYI